MQDNKTYSLHGIFRADTSRKSKTAGFTIVELLIVIVVIGILAAITIVAYNGIQQRARDSVMRADLTNVGKKFQLYQIANNAYPSSQTAGIRFSFSPVGQYVISCLDQTDQGAGFAIVAKDVKGSGQYYKYESTTGAISIVNPSSSDSVGLCATTSHPVYSWGAFWVVGG